MAVAELPFERITEDEFVAVLKEQRQGRAKDIDNHE